MRDVAHHLGDPGVFETVAQGQGVLRELLLTKAVLLVFDDVWKAADFQPFDVLGPRCRALVTTRDAGIIHTLHGELYPVDLFTKAEALSLLASAVEQTPDQLPPEAREVVEECGCLPLAVALCGGMAKKRDGEWDSILQRLRRADLEKIADREAIIEQHSSLYRAMQVSVEVLKPEEQRRFAELSVFVTDQTVPQAAIATLWAHTADLDDLDTDDLLINLNERALIRLDREDAKAGGRSVRSMSLHVLLYDFASRTAGNQQDLNQALLDAYRSRCPEGWHAGPDDGYFFRNLCRHLVTATGAWDESAEVLCDLRFVEARCRVGEVYELGADYRQALDSLPDERHRQLEVRKKDHQLDRYKQELISYSQAWSEALLSALKNEAGVISVVVPNLVLPVPPARDTTQQEMVSTEAAAHIIGYPQTAGSIANRIRAYADFVFRHSHVIASAPDDLIIVARNHATNGAVAEQAEGLVSRLSKPWVARDPRPPVASIDSSRCLRTLTGHAKPVSCVSVSIDGKIAVSASRDESLCVWDLTNGERLHTLYGHNSPVRAVAVAADGKTAISGGEAKFKTEGTWLANLDPPRLDTVSGMRYFLQSAPWDGILRVWDLESGRCQAILHGPSDSPVCFEVWCVAVTPDGRIAVSGGQNVRPDNRADFTIYVWDVSGGSCIRALEGHTNTVSSVAITPDGKTIVSASYDGTIRVWDLIAGNAARVFTSPMGSFGAPSIVYCAGVTPDGEKIVSVGHEEGTLDQTLRVWDMRSNQSQKVKGAAGLQYRTVALEPSGRVAVANGEKDTVCLWDIETEELLAEIEGHSGDITSLALVADGRIAVSASEDNTVRVWSFGEGKEERFFTGHSSEINTIAITADGKTALSAGYDPFVLVWNLRTRTIQSVFTGQGRYISSLKIAPDCKTVVSDNGKTLVKWDINTGHVYQEFGVDSLSNFHFIMAPDGKTLVLSDINRSGVRLLDIDSLRLLRLFDRHFSHVRCAITSPDGRKVITGGLDDQVCVFDIKTGRLLRSHLDHGGELKALAITPDGRVVVSAGADKTIRVWDIDSGQTFHLLEGHTDKLRDVVLTPDGRTIVSSSDDETIRIWDIRSGSLLRTYEHLQGAERITLTLDGRTSLTEGSRDRLLIWDVMSGETRGRYYPGIKVKTFSAIQVDNSFLCGTKDAHMHFLSVNGLNQDAPVITATRLFHVKGPFVVQDVQDDESSGANPIFGEEDTIPGDYEPDPTAICPWCASRFVPPSELLNTISSLTGHFLPNQSPCMMLPDEVWNDSRLFSPCQNCHKPIRFNPFIAEEEGAFSEEHATGLSFPSKSVHQINYYEGKLRQNPANLKALEGLAFYHGAQGDWDTAISYFKRIHALDPKEPRYYSNFALALLEKREVSEAMRLAQQAVAIADQRLRESKELSAAIKSAFNLEPPASEHGPRVSEQVRDLHTAYLTLGMAYEAASDEANAIEAYQQAIRTDAAGSVDVFLQIGNLFGKQQRLDEALEAYEQVVNLDPKNSMVYSNIAYVLEEKGDQERALEYLEKATEIDPQDPIVWFDLAAAYRNKGESSKATEFYEKSLSLNPHSYKTNLSLALIYEEVSSWEKSAEYYRRSLLLTEDENLKAAIEKQIEVVASKMNLT